MREPSGFPPPISEDGIRRILADENRLTLVAQPIIDLRRGLVVGYEALARFKLEVPAPPDVVFACADRAGLGAQLEAFVVKRALALSRLTPPNCFLTINLDPEHLSSPQVFDPITEHGSLGGIVFELTEQRQIADLQELASRLSELRKLGAFTAIDDAGEGYSGLRQILALRPEFLKVDRALVSHVHNDEAKRAMIQMLGELASRLDSWIIAEGIETEAELHTLAQLGVPLGQGYYLSRPSPPWIPLTPDVTHALQMLPPAPTSTGSVESLVEACTLCDLRSAWPANVACCVRVEVSGRPVAMRVLDENGERIRASHELLRVKRNTSLAAVALRCSARAERVRWDPIICVNDLGHFEGLIHAHKLVWALASRASGEE